MKRIVAIFLVAVIMIFGACGTVFAAEADPNITIVNPVADTPVNSTSLLISVKIMRPQTIKTTVLKETVTTQSTVAADGTVYTEHYTVYPICTPSRYSLWSGMYVHQHGAWNNCATLPGGYETFPRIL